MYPYRQIDRSHTLKLDNDKLKIRFPFNKKIIDRIEEVRRVDNRSHEYSENTHTFKYTPQTLMKLVDIAKKFDHKFEIDENVEVEDIMKLTSIYNKFLHNYFRVEKND